MVKARNLARRRRAKVTKPVKAAASWPAAACRSAARATRVVAIDTSTVRSSTRPAERPWMPVQRPRLCRLCIASLRVDRRRSARRTYIAVLALRR